MNYIHPILLSEVWFDIKEMVYENYRSEIRDNDIISIGTSAFKSLDQIKIEWPNYERYIAYQLEPFSDGHWYGKETILSNLVGFDEVWDYDLENIEFLKQNGIEAKYKPFVYTEALKRSNNLENPDIDVLFYGSLNNKRFQILSEISEYFNIVILKSVTGSKLDEFISRAKIILDLHSNDHRKQKQSRIFYSLINNKCVLSETSNFNYFKDLIIESNAQNMVSSIDLILRNNLWKNYLNVSDRFKLLSQQKLNNNN
jgi:hypothetical protein